MHVPLWALVAFVLLAAADFMLAVHIVRRRHHDHLIPPTPRAPRG